MGPEADLEALGAADASLSLVEEATDGEDVWRMEVVTGCWFSHRKASKSLPPINMNVQ